MINILARLFSLIYYSKKIIRMLHSYLQDELRTTHHASADVAQCCRNQTRH